ncbi:hypothetical protein QM467_15280 [Rhodoblastus sp. 17X3]|uniref:hypothetical protein n=1 Tax=Rhodoblastus sp. 17X3 TaxID=3047026 RepID=UPI0024B7C060|nr:hypothetical protein [Rhodoblastus sp. 17X3]MDI9849419.1 hypothetical protein [Rhodoblastus sp. 17X3]
MQPSEFLQKNNHWIGAIGIIAGIFVSLLTYFWSQNSGEISFSVKSVKVFESSPIENSIKITNNKGEELKGPIYGLEFSFWNSGDFILGTTSSDRIREPLQVQLLDSEAKIIDVSIQNANFPKSNIKTATDNSRAFTLNASEFDPDDAFKIFVLYTDSRPSAYSVHGKFVQTKIIDRSPEQEDDGLSISGFLAYLTFLWKAHPFLLMMFNLYIFMFFAISAMRYYQKKTDIRNTSLSYLIPAQFIVGLALILAMLFFDYIIAHQSKSIVNTFSKVD